MAESTNQTTNQALRTTATNVIELPLLHDKNFEVYITEYAKANDLLMRGEVWQAALAAARRLDYTDDRDAHNQLIASQPSFFQRVLRRFRRTRQPIQLTELGSIRAFLQLAPEAAAQQSEILWGPLRHGYGTWMIATLRPGGQQKGSRPTPPSLRIRMCQRHSRSDILGLKMECLKDHFLKRFLLCCPRR